MSGTPLNRTLDDVAEEGRRLAIAAQSQDLSLRLLGGVAVWCQCPSARRPELARDYGDADFIGRAEDRKRITAFLEAEGYEADRMFNALHGATRLNFHESARDRPVDVLLDRFATAHALDLRDSISADGLTIELADLLMTKLQVVSINEKDIRDLLALLLDHDFAPEEIRLERILEVTKNDWGKEVAPGITALATPGHTPGHTSFAVASGSSKVLIQSDVTNIPEFFLRNPDWHVAFDIDPIQAAATRHKFYDMAAAEKATVVGFHFQFPSIGYVEKAGTGYRLIPVAWNPTI